MQSGHGMLVGMIVVEFRRPTLDARVYEVAATATAHDDGAVTVTGDASVVPSYPVVGRGSSGATNVERWVTRLGSAPEALFVIPLVVERNGVPLPDPHQAAREHIARQPAVHAPDDALPPARREWQPRRPRKHWKTPAHSRGWATE